MVSSVILTAGLLAANMAIYSLIALSVRRGRRPLRATNLAEAFQVLDAALRRKFPDLPMGLTWEEALDRLHASESDDGELRAALEVYEASRFGGVPAGQADYREVLRVAKTIGGSRDGS